VKTNKQTFILYQIARSTTLVKIKFCLSDGQAQFRKRGQINILALFCEPTGSNSAQVVAESRKRKQNKTKQNKCLFLFDSFKLLTSLNNLKQP
jgi:hypothetical protein